LSVGSAGAATQQQIATTAVTVKAGEFFFKLSKRSITRPGTVAFTIKNVGHIAHDFKIAGKKTALIQPGKSARLKVVFKKAGKFTYLCTVPGHAANSMEGRFTVR
jgi:plastocyanin